MEKQIVIYTKDEIIQNITTNFDCSYQIIDCSWAGDDIGDILEPDIVKLDQYIFEE